MSQPINNGDSAYNYRAARLQESAISCTVTVISGFYQIIVVRLRQFQVSPLSGDETRAKQLQ
jgi:hypothetical protein